MSDVRLIWLDLEMTGLNTLEDYIIEIATVVTTAELEVVAEGPNLALFQPDSILDAMDDWNKAHHAASGLIELVRASTLDAEAAERETLTFLREHVAAGASPMCGNSVCQDRRFLSREMPKLEAYFHYRHLDVSTLKILADLWHPALPRFSKEASQHRALSDVHDSIAELAYYRRHMLKTEGA